MTATPAPAPGQLPDPLPAFTIDDAPLIATGAPCATRCGECLTCLLFLSKLSANKLLFVRWLRAHGLITDEIEGEAPAQLPVTPIDAWGTAGGSAA